MTALEALRQAEQARLVDGEGNETYVELLPPLSDAELERLEAGLPCPVPPEVRELLS